MARWERRLFCKCGYSVYDNGFQCSFFRHEQPCPDCGHSWDSVKPKVVRWVHVPRQNERWWKPWTWGAKGRWEEPAATE